MNLTQWVGNWVSYRQNNEKSWITQKQSCKARPYAHSWGKVVWTPRVEIFQYWMVPIFAFFFFNKILISQNQRRVKTLDEKDSAEKRAPGERSGRKRIVLCVENEVWGPPVTAVGDGVWVGSLIVCTWFFSFGWHSMKGPLFYCNINRTPRYLKVDHGQLDRSARPPPLAMVWFHGRPSSRVWELSLSVLHALCRSALTFGL